MIRVGILACCVAAAAAQEFAVRRIGAPSGVAGAALDRRTLYTWGEGVTAWRLPGGESRRLAAGRYGEAGCVTDVDGDGAPDLVLIEASGRLVWLKAPRWTRSEIDSGIETHDVVPAVLFGRRGVLLVQKHMQVRFYEPPGRRYREIYSFYTPSRQAGLLLDDVDGDGRTDIFCGNYWIRSPERFELPWRLFAINTWNETPISAMARLARPDARSLIVAEGEVAGGRLARFERPADPRRLWIERRLDAGLNLQRPHALVAADFTGDGRIDLAAGENNGPRSRLFLFIAGGGVRQIGAGIPALAAWALEVDGRRELVTAGSGVIACYRRK